MKTHHTLYIVLLSLTFIYVICMFVYAALVPHSLVEFTVKEKSSILQPSVSFDCLCEEGTSNLIRCNRITYNSTEKLCNNGKNCCNGTCDERGNCICYSTIFRNQPCKVLITKHNSSQLYLARDDVELPYNASAEINSKVWLFYNKESDHGSSLTDGTYSETIHTNEHNVLVLISFLYVLILIIVSLVWYWLLKVNDIRPIILSLSISLIIVLITVIILPTIQGSIKIISIVIGSIILTAIILSIMYEVMMSRTQKESDKK